MKAPDKYRVLILTDHRIHSPVESIYHIARHMAADASCRHIHTVSRGIAGNAAFFDDPRDMPLSATAVGEGFSHSETGRAFTESRFEVSPLDYDVVMLRLPRVNSMDFFERIGGLIPPERMINRPRGIMETGNKEYLLNFPELCPPIRLCNTLEDVIGFKSRFPVVLKPLNNSGGRGLVRLDGDRAVAGTTEMSWEEVLPVLEKELETGYLGMKFLENVTQGDKRIIVANGQVVAASLRVPAEGSWLCNVSMGASSEAARPDEEELAMARRIVPDLLSKGVVLFGFDTLVGDDGKRKLSELNTSCVNGIYPAEMHSGRPVTRITAGLLWQYIKTNIK